MQEWPTKGDLAIVPQKVEIVKLNEAGYPTKLKIVDKPLLAIVFDSNTSFTDIIYDNEVWTVPTYKLNKGESYAGKTD